MALKSVESQNVEFKSRWRDEYLKVICAFANADGGKLISGMDDKGKPVGVGNARKLLEDVPNKMRDILGIIPKVITESRKGKDTLIIEVKPSYTPISYHGRYLVRSGSTIQELKGKELTKFLISKSGREWDNRSWEHTVSFCLEDNPQVFSYAKNDHLDFSIPYDHLGARHYYYPDFLIQYETGHDETMVILEVKGFESEQDRQKKQPLNDGSRRSIIMAAMGNGN